MCAEKGNACIFVMSQSATKLYVSIKFSSVSHGNHTIKSAQILTSTPSSLFRFLVFISKSFIYLPS